MTSYSSLNLHPIASSATTQRQQFALAGAFGLGTTSLYRGTEKPEALAGGKLCLGMGNLAGGLVGDSISDRNWVAFIRPERFRQSGRYRQIALPT